MTGGRVAHPLLISLANLLMDFRTKASNHAFQLLALLPVPHFIHKNRKIRGILENRLIHQCLDFILEPLKIAAEVGIMMSDPLGSVRYVYTPLAAYIVDTQEAIALSGVAGKTSHLTMATYKQFGDAFRHRPCSATKTLKLIATVEKSCDPWNLEAYIKAASSYRLNGVHRPFWRDWPLSDPAKFFTPEPLHHWHKMFWDHDAQWCIRAVGSAEIDFHFSILHPQTGFRQFHEGISKLKQVTGREHCDIQRYLVAVIADAVPRDFLIAIRALSDFRYFAQAPEISDEIRAVIDRALKEFHDHKDVIIKAGARVGKGGQVIDNWHIPKLELLQSITASIAESRAPIQWSADHTERCHITEIKDPSRSTNNQGYEAQICHHLDRDEKCRQFDLATAIREAAIDFCPIYSGNTDDEDAGSADLGLEVGIDGSLAVVETTSGLLSQIQPVLSSTRTGAVRRHADHFNLANALERNVYPHAPLPHRTMVRGDTALHLARDPTLNLKVDEVAEQFDIPDLRGALADFLASRGGNKALGGRRIATKDANLPFNYLQVWVKVQLQNRAYHGPHNILPPQTVNAAPPPSGRSTFHHADVILLNTDTSQVWPASGLEGNVDQIHMQTRVDLR